MRIGSEALSESGSNQQHPFSGYSDAEAQSIGGLTKRYFDILFCVTAIPLILPIIIVIAFLVLLSGNTKVLYAHQRIGFCGRPFSCWKFRTMSTNGDEILQKYLSEFPEERATWLSIRKLRNDPRVTVLGRFLRKSSLDELPQIFNVLTGEMSVVGPRPIVYDELKMYGSSKGHYLRNRPGITGMWQVSGRSDASYRTRIALDRFYTQHWTFCLDLHVIVATIPAVVFGKGAL